MVKGNAEKVRDAESRKRERGLHEYRIWAPKTAEAERALRDFADRLTQEFEAAKAAESQ